MAQVELNVDTGDITRLNQAAKGFIENVPAIEEETSKEFAEDLENAVKESVRKTFSNDGSTGQLEDNVEASREGNGRWSVSANAYNDGVNYAAWHEYAEDSHYAYYEDETGENRELIRWAKIKGIYQNTWRIEVEPKSFMKPGVREAISKARKRMSSGKSAAQSGLQKAFGK